MKNNVHLFCLGFLIIFVLTASAFAWPTYKNSGVNRYDNKAGTMLESKSSWTSADPSVCLSVWMQIEKNTDIENGNSRFSYKVETFSPDGSFNFKEGPYGFDTEGMAKINPQIATFLNSRTSQSPKPNFGNWRIKYSYLDKTTGEDQFVKELQVEITDAGTVPATAAQSTIPPASSEVFKLIKANDLLKVRDLLKSDSNAINSKDENGATPLIVAAEYGQAAICEMLLNKGADVNAVYADAGWTALQKASWNGMEAAVILLVKRGANVNAKELRNGDTALHYAAQKNHKNIVAFLLANGADTTAKGWSGLTPLELAEKFNSADTAALLK